MAKSNNYVYFVKDRRTGEVKIGRSNNPARRIRELERQRGAKLRVLGIFADPDLEKSLHQTLRGHRTSGEWFKDSRAVRRELNHLKGRGLEVKLSEDGIDRIGWGVVSIFLLWLVLIQAKFLASLGVFMLSAYGLFWFCGTLLLLTWIWAKGVRNL